LRLRSPGASAIHAGAPGDERVILDTLWRFEGLERAVVLLTEIAALSPKRAEHLLYVGTSRPGLTASSPSPTPSPDST